MANPTPIYRIKVNGSFLPGYVQNDNRPLSFKTTGQGILNRNGGIVFNNGADIRKLSFEIRILSRLSSGTGQQHLDDCKSQYRDALAILARAGSDEVELRLGDQDRYTLGVVTSVSAPFEAASSRAVTYTVQFDSEPFYRNPTESTATFSGNGTVNITLADTRETYPQFTIPSTVTAFIATHAASGKVVDFTRGTFGGTILVDCGRITATQNGVDASSTMNNVNFGIKHTAGAGTFSVAITGYAGSGNVTVGIKERYEL